MDMTVAFPGGERVDASFGGFVVSTDQPRDGRAGSAPSPFEIFVASIGTCAGFYVLKFLERRGLSTRDVRLSIHASKDPARGVLDEVTIRVELPESFPLEYRNAVLNAANRCTVKRSLLEPPTVRTVVEVGRRIVAESASRRDDRAPVDENSLSLDPPAA